MNLNLNNRVAAVAAASQGLGFAAALELSREGATVGICSRDAGRISQAAERIRGETGGSVLALPVDVSRTQEARAFVDAVAKEFGTLDILVTNAGGPPPGALDDIDEAGIDK
ncbi:MAG: SDR family NAD(P)-dependent oxidoreductase, partial [Candidatus Latescibacterota bacterium]